jgi:ribosomal protein L11 methyltransferase
MGKYANIMATVPALHTDTVGCLFDELGSLGCEIRGEDPVTFIAYFEGGDNLSALVRLIKLRLEDIGLDADSYELSMAEVPDRDWEAEWRRTLSPIRVGHTWLIRPSWQSGDGFDRIPIIIDPKMAFGTGTHPTTQLCLVELEDLVRPEMSVLDVGAGTAILSIAAARKGAKKVVAVEIDEVAVECARENVELNGVPGIVQLVTGTLADVPRQPYDLIVANIEARTLTAIASDLRPYLAKGGYAVFSGILEMEADQFSTDIAGLGWKIVRRRRQFDPMTDDGWVAITAQVS